MEDQLGALMVAAQRGDQRAYRELLGRCMPSIIATARRQGVADALIDDVVQDVLMTLHTARATYDPLHPFLPWLHAIARFRAVDALRRQGRQRSRELHAPAAMETTAAEDHRIDERLDWSARSVPLASAIKALPQGQRQAVERLALGEQTLADASRETGRSKTALKVNLHRAINALRNRLGARPEEGGDV